MTRRRRLAGASHSCPVRLKKRWVRLRGEQGPVYVAHAAFGQGYYTWCDTAHGHAAEPYLDPVEAIQAGLQRATRRTAITG